MTWRTRRGPGAAAVAGAAGDEAAHRVADQRDPLDLDRPVAHQLVQQRRERGAVLGDVAAGVEADEDGRDVVEQVAVVGRAPRVLGLSEAVDEDDDVRRHGRAEPAHLHRDRERAALGLEPVAEQAVQGGDRHRAARCLAQRHLAGARAGRDARGVRAEPQPAAHAPVDAARDRVVHEAHGRSGRAERPEDAVGDRAVDVADPARERAQLLARDPAQLTRLELGLRHSRVLPKALDDRSRRDQAARRLGDPHLAEHHVPPSPRDHRARRQVLPARGAEVVDVQRDSRAGRATRARRRRPTTRPCRRCRSGSRSRRRGRRRPSSPARAGTGGRGSPRRSRSSPAAGRGAPPAASAG